MSSNISRAVKGANRGFGQAGGEDADEERARTRREAVGQRSA